MVLQPRECAKIRKMSESLRKNHISRLGRIDTVDRENEKKRDKRGSCRKVKKKRAFEVFLVVSADVKSASETSIATKEKRTPRREA